MSLRQQIASDLASGRLTHSPLVETGADRIGGLGLSDRLGAAIWRILAEHDVGATREAVVLLAKMLAPRGARMGRARHRRLLAVCWMAVQEKLADKCRKCSGRGFIFRGEGVQDACTACEGTRIGRHSDTERIKALGCTREEYQRLGPVFAEAHATLGDAEVRVGRQLARQLERGRH